MIAGRLRHKITIQSPPTTLSGYGDKIGDWTDYYTDLFDIVDMASREAQQARQILSSVDFIVKGRIWKNKPVNATMRLLFGTRIFDIKAPINKGERNRVLLLLCVERT